MKRVTILLLTAALSFLAASFYTLKLNPEVALYRALADEQQRTLESTGNASRVLVIGGSSAMFSIDPALLHEEFAIAAANLGIQAGAGRALQLELALQHARPGDLVVIAFETIAYTRSADILFTPLGSQLWYGAFAEHFPNGSRLNEIALEPAYAPTDLRPGGHHVLTLFVKVALRLPLNRYSPDDMRTGGFMVTGYRPETLRPVDEASRLSLSPDMRDLLERFVAALHNRGANAAFSLPWQLLSPSAIESQRAHNKDLARELETIAPVLADPHWGAESDPNLFADSEWHLNGQGAEVRSRLVGLSLQNLLPQPDS